MNGRTEAVGITVYGCEQDEAAMFDELSPRFGVVPTITGIAVSEAGAVTVPGNRCISVDHRTSISAPVLAALKDAGVEHISTRSIGLDHIDLTAAETLGITVENVVYSPDGVADFTLMLTLMAIRNAKAIVSAAGHPHVGCEGVRGRELRDMTVGVVGVGHIGAAVIQRLRGFGCRVLATSNSPKATAATRVPLDELLLESDVVSLHLPLTPDTHHLIGPKEIEVMKQGAFLVNTGRGALVDTEALIAALEGGRLGGAALDVLEGEEDAFCSDRTEQRVGGRLLPRLQQLPNVIVTPHRAYRTERALHEIVEVTLRSCVRFAGRACR